MLQRLFAVSLVWSVSACAWRDAAPDCADTVFFADADGDGFGDAGRSVAACAAPAGHVLDGTDCDDADASASPGGAEVCDKVDNDCDGVVDEDAVDIRSWYPDEDGDGYGQAVAPIVHCEQPPGHVGDATDCDDADGQVHPGAVEVCDGGDNNCDAQVDGPDAADAAVWYADADGDGHGDDEVVVVSCAPPAGHVGSGGDCDDASALVYPGAEEVCDGADSDCDGVVEEALVPTDHVSVQAALRAGARDICVEPGTHQENIDITDMSGVRISGMGGSGMVTIDALGRGRAILVERADDVVLSGLTLTNGEISDLRGGAGIMVVDSADVTIQDIVAHDLSCDGVCYGAAIGAFDSAAVTMADISVSDSRSVGTYGYSHVGFVGAFSSDLVADGIEVYDCTIEQTGYTWGGGFGFFGDGSSTLSANDVSVHDLVLTGDNFRSTGVMVYRAASVSLANVSVTAVDAQAASSASGPLIIIDIKGDVDGTNIEVVGNTTAVTSGLVHTAGFWNHWVSGHSTYTNVLVAGNTASGTHGYSGAFMESETAGAARYTNVTVHGNESAISTYFYGEGAFSCFGSSIEVVNATVTGNTVGGGGVGEGSTVAGGWSDVWAQDSDCRWAVSYSNVYGNGIDFGDSLSDWTGADGNLSAAPGYTDVSGADPLRWDLRVPHTSPLYDAGDPTISDADKTPSDIGAYGGPSGDAW